VRLRLLCGSLALIVLVCTAVAEAHHLSGHGGGTTLFNPFSTLSRPPRTFVGYTFAFDSLDGDLGEVYTNQISGEYAFHRRFSAGLRLPIVSIRRSRLVAQDGLGDLALTAKFLAGEWEKLFLSVGTDVTLPTGSEAKGLGEGAVMASPFVTLSKEFPFLDLFGTLGSTVGFSHNPRPSLDFATGVNVPLLKKNPQLEAFLALQGSTTFSSDVLTSGSTKIYLKPGITVSPIENLRFSLGGKFSVVDTLKLKNGVALAPTSPVLLTDVVYGFLFDVHYNF
jgi:hypothetical protein